MKLADTQFYVYGGSHYGQALTAYLTEMGLRPRAILDRAPKFKEYAGVPCVTFPHADLDTNYPVIVTILGFSGVEEDLRQAGFQHIIDTLASFDIFPAALQKLNECGVLWMQAPASSQINKTCCEEVLSLLSDQRSRHTFEQIVNYRSKPCRQYYPIPEQYEMYFPQGIPDLYQYDTMRILDIGAFDGDTFAAFYARYAASIEDYTALEASANNIKLFLNRMHAMGVEGKPVNIRRLAVGLPEGQRLRVEENSSATVVSVVAADEEVPPNCLVESVNLGTIMHQVRCNVLKMDIEGADFDALCQADEYISKCTPTLALSLYHTPEDLWRIPLLIESYAPGRYHYYLRQEGHWLLETQLYAVPKPSLL